jgi:hypothetical protein
MGRKQIFAVNYRRFRYALESGTQMSLDFTAAIFRVRPKAVAGHLSTLALYSDPIYFLAGKNLDWKTVKYMRNSWKRVFDFPILRKVLKDQN